MKFKDLPSEARSYIMMHTYGSPLMVGESALLVYLVLTGYRILQIGAIYTIVNIVLVISPLIIGKSLDYKISAKKIMILIWILEGIGYLLLFFSYGIHATLILTLGILTIKFATIFYPVYPTYEHFAFPSNILEKAFFYHIIIPELVQIVAFPLFGFILTYVFSTPEAYRTLFAGIFIGSILMALYVKFKIKDIPKAKFEIEKKRKRKKLHKRFYFLFSMEVCLMLAEGLISNIIIIYFVIAVLKQTFFMAMLLEVVNSLVTLILGNILKNREMDRRSWLIFGVFLFALTQIFFIAAGYFKSIVPVLIAVTASTAGNVFWFPVHRSMLYRTIPESKRGSIFGMMSTFSKTIGIFIPLLAAALMNLSKYLPFIAALILYVMCIVGYIRITKPQNVTKIDE